MKITQVFNGYCDPELYGVVVVFAPGGKEHSAYIDLELRTDQLRTPIEAHQGEGEDPTPLSKFRQRPNNKSSKRHLGIHDHPIWMIVVLVCLYSVGLVVWALLPARRASLSENLRWNSTIGARNANSEL